MNELEAIEIAPVDETAKVTDTADEASATAEEVDSRDDDGSTEPETPDELTALRSEVALLHAQLEGERALYGRLSAECAEFSELYPTVSLSELPDGIWESVKKGVPIAAAYALHERRIALERAKAEQVNSANSRASSGSLESPPTEEFFTPDEVRAMSPSEVRTNYTTIIRSMSKWH